MGIRIQAKTNRRATLNLLNKVSSYLFEEEYGELSSATASQKKAIKDCQKALSEMVK